MINKNIEFKRVCKLLNFLSKCECMGCGYGIVYIGVACCTLTSRDTCMQNESSISMNFLKIMLEICYKLCNFSLKRRPFSTWKIVTNYISNWAAAGELGNCYELIN